MKELTHARDVVGRPVVTVDGGEDIAEIKDVVLSLEEHRVIAFTLNRRGALASPMDEVLPAEAIAAVGADAVMVASADALASTAAVAAGENIVGTAVVTERGEAAGEIDDVVIATDDDFRVVGLEVSDGDTRRLLPLSELVGSLGDVVVVRADAETFTHDDIRGFGAAVGVANDTKEAS